MHDNYRQYWTFTEATALQGKTVATNAGCTVIITGMACVGEDEYEVVANDGHNYKKCCNNGLYCWITWQPE